MRSSTVRRVGVGLLAIGLITTAWSVYTGMIKFYLVVIVPVLTSDNALGSLPLLAIFAGIVLMALGPAFGEDDQDATHPGEYANVKDGPNEDRKKVGGVVLIGPIPILFGSDKRTTLIAAAIAIMILAIIILFLL
ncbi:MAG: DUF131 domain-containing protein [Methanomassiliicoccales archaeon]|jgi:uncharacterized protein (TIGR00304 family)